MKNFRIFFFFLSVFCICYLCTRIGSKRSKKQASAWMCLRVSACLRRFRVVVGAFAVLFVCFGVVWRSCFRGNIFSVLSFFVASFPLLVYLWSSFLWQNSPNIFESFVSSPFRSVPSVPCVRRRARMCALDARVSTRVVSAKPSERERAFRV